MAINSPGVYTLTMNNKEYVGSSGNPHRRMIEHKSLLRKGKHSNAHLQNAYNLYADSLEYRLLQEFATREEAIEFEQKYMDENELYKNGYNRDPIAKTRKPLEGKLTYAMTEKHKENLKGPRPHTRGQNHFRVRPIYIYNREHKYVMTWLNGCSSLSEGLNLNRRAINNNLKGRSKYCGDFVFSYNYINPSTHGK